MTEHISEIGRTGDLAESVTHYRVKDSVIIRDERHFLNSGWYVVANPSVFKTWHFGADRFGVLQYLLDPRSSTDIEQYRASLPVTAELAEPEQMSKFIKALQQTGIIESVPKDADRIRSVCAASRLPFSGYEPASAPSSMVIELPMSPEVFHRLMREVDTLGVLGVDFRGSNTALRFIVDEREALQGLRAAVAIWVCAADPAEPTRELLARVAAVLGRHPFIIVNTHTALSPADSVVQVLQSQSVPFCITYHVKPSDAPSYLRQIAANALAAGAAFTHFLLDADSFSSDSMTPTAVAEKLAVLGEIQWGHEPMRVQVRAPGLPLPYYVTVPLPTLGQLFSSYLGGCSKGLIPRPMPVHVRPIWIESTADEMPSGAGPRLPMSCCQAGMTHLAVSKEGLIYPCEEALGIETLVMGDLHRDSLTAIWHYEQWTFLRGGSGVPLFDGSDAHLGCTCRRGWARANTRNDMSSRL